MTTYRQHKMNPWAVIKGVTKPLTPDASDLPTDTSIISTRCFLGAP